MDCLDLQDDRGATTSSYITMPQSDNPDPHPSVAPYDQDIGSPCNNLFVYSFCPSLSVQMV